VTVHVAGRVWHVPRIAWSRLQTADWPLLAAVLAAVVAGMAMLYSATLRGGPTEHAWDDLVVKQAVFVLVGLVVLVLFAGTEYRALIALAPWLYGAAVVGLVAILSVGSIFGGSQRWFDLGALAIQPSELAKIVLIISLVAFWERYDVRRLRYVLASLVLVGVPALLVLKQPNLSTAILLGFIWLGVTFAAGVRPLHLSLIALLMAPTVAFVLRSGLIRSYQMARIVALIDPSADPQHTGYQNIQTLLAVGNGGLTGTGFASGLQSQGGWLPLAFTDNIYALVAEELGFVGGVAVLVLLLFIVWRVVRTALGAQDRGGALIAAGVASYLLAQIAVNVGVVLQLLPVTGLSLPFLSYGGSSLFTLFAAIGLVQAVSTRRKPLEFR
jgi:rod shape determining protein RodA